MKMDELKDKSIDELKDLLAEQELKLNQLKFKAGVHQLNTMHEFTVARQTIARIKTILRDKELNNIK